MNIVVHRNSYSWLKTVQICAVSWNYVPLFFLVHIPVSFWIWSWAGRGRLSQWCMVYTGTPLSLFFFKKWKFYTKKIYRSEFMSIFRAERAWGIDKYLCLIYQYLICYNLCNLSTAGQDNVRAKKCLVKPVKLINGMER